MESDTIQETMNRIEIDGEEYLIMIKELFDLRIGYAYRNGQINAYQDVIDNQRR